MASTNSPWDAHAVRVAVSQIQSLVDGFASDFTGDGFRDALASVTRELVTESVDERVALLLYGAAVVGAASLSLAAELGRSTTADVRAATGQAVNTWLDGPLFDVE